MAWRMHIISFYPHHIRSSNSWRHTDSGHGRQDTRPVVANQWSADPQWSVRSERLTTAALGHTGSLFSGNKAVEQAQGCRAGALVAHNSQTSGQLGPCHSPSTRSPPGAGGR